MAWRIDAGLAELIEANAWTFGPCATSRRILDLTIAGHLDPGDAWPEILAACPRLAPLGYWMNALAAGCELQQLAADHRIREARLVAALDRLLADRTRILLVGHDLEIEALWRDGGRRRSWRYLLLDGPAGAMPPGADAHRWQPKPADLADPLPFALLEQALDWAEAVVLAGFTMHRWNILGPGQLRPLIAAARDQCEVVALCALNERRLVLGEGAPRQYREDFRPYLWQHQVTHLVSEWADGHAGTVMGWLPMPPGMLEDQLAGLPADVTGTP